MVRISSFVTIVTIMLATVKTVDAGGGGGTPAVRVITPGAANGTGMELDDLPEPQLEVPRHPAKVDPPPVPAFDRASTVKQLEIEPDVEATSPRLRKAIEQATLDASIERLNACNRAIAARQYDAAVAACRAALDVWPDNHLAWYALASAHIARQAWREASAAAERAVALRPDRAMYQLYHGISLYEAERQRVREAQLRESHGRSEDIELDLARLELDPARDALALAARLAPALWRAHDYLGRVYRDLGDPRRAAREFTAAIKAHPGHRGSYVALAELYRTSDYLEQALAVAALGITQVPAGEAADLWFEVGMACDARRADDQAIEAFGKAIALRPDDGLAKLQRGQLYLRRGDAAGAERDLGDVMRSQDARAAAAKPFIAKLLERIASGKAARDTRWDCRRSGDMLLCQPRSH